MNTQNRPVVLLIDDQPELLAVMSMYFKHYGYTYFTSESANLALEILANEKIDLVICDMVMPVVNGLELFKKVRETHPDRPHFIFCSGLCEIPLKKPYPDGVLGFVQKPFSMMDLMNSLEAHFKMTETT
jgi:CheY-like chemotaxis protein